MDPITLDQFAEELRELAAEDPDRRNPESTINSGCAYRAEDEDGNVSRCIIGEWLHRKGYETEDWHEGSAADAVIPQLVGAIDRNVLILAARVQRFVDRTEDPDDFDSPFNRWIDAKPVIDEVLEELRNF